MREQVEAELDDVLDGRPPTADDVQRLPVIGPVLNESLRLYPPAYAFAREAIEDVEIDDVLVRRRTTVVVSQWVMHRDPRWFERPEEFDPDRWIGGLEQRLPRSVFMPFGGGPHQCIGAHFAMLEATLLLATIAQRFRLDLDDDAPLVPEPLVTLRPRDVLRVTLQQTPQSSMAHQG